MGRPEIHANLLTQCDRLRAHISAQRGLGLAAPTEQADHLSRLLFLSHGSTPTKFASICREGQLMSRVAYNQKHPDQPLSLDVIDLQLGTEDSIFFYAAPFRYPKSVCGFLFAASIEDERSHDGTASPFDSGGLVHKMVFPAEFASPADFLREHEFPIPGHRDYLSLSMDNLFDHPESYIEGRAPIIPGCLGLSDGDERMWTHEVRLPKRVALRGRHLRAVFAHRALPGSNSEIEALFEWCATEDVDRVVFDGPAAGDFETLKRECISYLRKKLY
jgi:hypothetical protein